MKVEYQVSSHGADRFSVQVFRRDTAALVADANIVRDVNGWKVVCIIANGHGTDRPQHATPEAAAKWFATGVADELESEQ